MARGKGKKNICPGCSSEFDKLINNKCPVCGVNLILDRQKQGQRNVVKYVLADIPEVNEQIPIEETVHENTLIDDSGTQHMTSVVVRKLGNAHWQVIYKSFVQRAVCPNCSKLQFNIVHATHGHKIERKCDKCHNMVTYEFKFQ